MIPDRAAVCTLVLAGTLGAASVPVFAQEPPDTVLIGDSLAVADSLAGPDSLALDPAVDSVSADTIFYNLPSVESGIPAGYATGIWTWDRGEIMASGANTLAELFQDVPGLITLLGGDYGTPAAMSAFGQGGAGYRVVRDGLELYPVAGGVADLQRIGLAGIQRVRLDRSVGQMRVELWSHEDDDGRPYSRIEAGTGDLDTNMFRGLYADPTAMRGSIAAGLERVDTRGRGPEEGGNRTGSWLRYQLHMGDRAGIAFDVRSVGTQTKVVDYTPTTSRTDVMIKASMRVLDGVVVEGYTGKSSYTAEVPRPGSTLAGGSRTQRGGRLGLDLGAFWANGAFRFYEGELPSRRIDVSGGLRRSGWGGVSGRFTGAVFNGVQTSNFGARVWAGPRVGVTLFGAYEAGEFGSRNAPLQEGPGPPPLLQPTEIVPGVEAITDRTTIRAGASISLGGVTLAGAGLHVTSDVALPLGTELDLGSPDAEGMSRYGVEGAVVFPTMWRGLTLQGSYQGWEEEGPYLPRNVYRGSFEFHRVYKETENLEWWFSMGVRGHDPMPTFVADDGAGGPGGLVTVPFYQNWYIRVQVRVVTVRIFLGWDNFTLRRNNQNYPGRTLPFARSFFGLRWTMWN